VVLPHDDLGTGPVILLLHAGIADRRMWSGQLKPLAAGGYRVIALDMRGFGEAPMAVEQDAPWADVLETLDWLGVERMALVGNSFGGAVAQRVAVMAPARPWALALISSPDEALEPSPRLKAVWEAEEAAIEMEDFDAAVQIIVEAWTLPEAPARLRLKVAQMQRRALELQVQDGQTPEGVDPLERDPGALARLRMPTLVACGTDEMSDFQEAAGRLAAIIPGARSLRFEGAGHLAPMERPKEFNEELLGFLDEARAELSS
jgi:3-oxoadipate enol-lactonase